MDTNFGPKEDTTPATAPTEPPLDNACPGSSIDTPYVIVGDRHFTFDPLPTYTSSSGAMHFAGYDNPSTSWKSRQVDPSTPLAIPTPERTLPVSPGTIEGNTHIDSTWQPPRRSSPQKHITPRVLVETETSNSFTAIALQDDVSGEDVEDSSSAEEEVESFSNDPLDQHEDKSPTPKVKKGRGRHKKGQSKAKFISRRSIILEIRFPFLRPWKRLQQLRPLSSRLTTPSLLIMV